MILVMSNIIAIQTQIVVRQAIQNNSEPKQNFAIAKVKFIHPYQNVSAWQKIKPVSSFCKMKAIALSTLINNQKLIINYVINYNQFNTF